MTKDIPTDNIEIPVSATCRNSAACLFSGKDINIYIKIQNDTSENIELPLAYLKARGPSVKLVDRKTNEGFYTPPNLVDEALLTKLETLEPGKSAQLEWVIMASELQRPNPVNVDINAEISIYLEGIINGKPTGVIGKHTIHITDGEK